MQRNRQLPERSDARHAVRQAAQIANLVTQRQPGVRRVSLPDDTGDPAIAPGGIAHLASVKAPDLKPGRLVMVRVGAVLQVRRFIKFSYGGTALMVHVAPPSGGPLDPPLPGTHVLGEVTMLEDARGTTYTVQLAGGSPVMNWLTDYGTCRPAEKLGRVLKRMVPQFRMR